MSAEHKLEALRTRINVSPSFPLSGQMLNAFDAPHLRLWRSFSHQLDHARARKISKIDRSISIVGEGEELSGQIPLQNQ
jgi:hypothetical protein